MDIPVGTLLKEWQSYATTISRNLMELSEQTDVKLIILKVKDAANGYTGLTKMKASRAVDDLDTLWRYYSLLSGVVDKASILYSKDSFLNDTEHKVKELLENASITLETERIDISNRSLLSPENHYTKGTLKELLKFMQESFETIRNTFNEISHAAQILETRFESIQNEIKNLNNTAKRLKVTDMPLFDVKRAAKIESDPLQGLAELDTLSCSIERYKASIMSAEQDYNKTVDTLNRVRDMLYEIQDIAKKSENAALMSKKIFGTAYSPSPVVSQDVLKSLQDWLTVLENKLSEGSLNAAKVGVQRLENECAMKLDAQRENYYNDSKDYNEWLDLKGEFEALLAKFQGLKIRGKSFDNSSNDLVKSIQTALNADNVNLISCRQLIEKFNLSLKS